MADRRGMPWLAGLGAIAAVCLGIGAAVEVWSAQLFHEVDLYYRSLTGTDPEDMTTSAYYDSVWRWTNGLHQVVSPLVAGGVLALLALLTALAVRWDRHERSRA